LGEKIGFQALVSILGPLFQPGYVAHWWEIFKWPLLSSYRRNAFLMFT
jgi:hypothetical protein